MARARTFGMSRRDVQSLYGSLRDQDEFLESRRGRDPQGPIRQRTVTEKVVETVEIAGTAAVIGVIAGRAGTPNFGSTPIPVGLTVGLAAHVANMFDVVPASWVPHVHNIANGAIAGWAAVWGAGQGAAMALRAGQPPQQRALAAGERPEAYRQLERAPVYAAPAALPQPQFAYLPPAPAQQWPANAAYGQPVARRVSTLSEAELQTIMQRRAA